MSDLRDLYQEVILDHGRSPRNFGVLENATCEAHGDNPLCGDKVHVTLILEDGVVRDVKFEGSGCAVSMASASLMTEAVKGKTEAEARALFEGFHDLMTSGGEVDLDELERLDKLAVFEGVRGFPMRVKCATLGWHTLNAALDNDAQPVTTE
jgi:nitrogen fixation NifU-like protein